MVNVGKEKWRVHFDRETEAHPPNERCSHTALGGVSLDNAFDLIEGHPTAKLRYNNGSNLARLVRIRRILGGRAEIEAKY